MQCPRCKTALAKGAMECPVCGRALAEAKATTWTYARARPYRRTKAIGFLSGVEPRPHRWMAAIGMVAISGIVFAVVVTTRPAHGTAPPVRIADAVATDTAHVRGDSFFKRSVSIAYRGGPIVLAADENGTRPTSVDDVLEVTVRHPDGSLASDAHDYSSFCSRGVSERAPTDYARLFRPGVNRVTVLLRDQCGTVRWSTPLWLTSR